MSNTEELIYFDNQYYTEGINTFYEDHKIICSTCGESRFEEQGKFNYNEVFLCFECLRRKKRRLEK